MSFRFRVADLRELNGERFLDSKAVGDQILSVLMRLKNRREAIRRILATIATLDARAREEALGQLMVICGLRKLEAVIEEEATDMPVIIDPMENRVIKRYFLQGKEEGKQAGKQEGERDGAMSLLTRQLERRFGPLPRAATRKLKAADLATLEEWSLRLLDASSLEQALKSK